ncbi:PASTA domain-containing protein [Nocardioides sp. LS1]|uniref:PASTA domain-containing protein n=1 Tax=Nocardioides sp. LS1 TaxID=1027620 RepID=UPI000F61D12A|nr:PASTA domain-containing protein [Nocardioides sp. LS1]GCD88991.1 hypothetical protein NLS1_09970 [Nocardioides sp. LS1]
MRRRGLVVGAGALSVVLLVGGYVAWDRWPRALPDHPGGFRLAGAGEVLVPVPEDWPVLVGGCADPSVPALVYETVADQGTKCYGGVHPPVSTITVLEPHSGLEDAAPNGLHPTGETVEGHAIVANETICELPSTPVCTQTFGLPDFDSYFTVTLVERESADDMTELRTGMRLVPRGWTTVPFVQNTYPPSPVDGALEAAGLQVRTTQEPHPYDAGSFLRTQPPLGTAVRRGSTVLVVLSSGPQPS